MKMANFNNYLMTFTVKIEEAVSLVPEMTADQKLKAVQHWNVVSEKLQDIVNSSAADIGALTFELEKEKEGEKDTNDLEVDDVMNPSPEVPNLNQDERISLQPLSAEPFQPDVINAKFDCPSIAELTDKDATESNASTPQNDKEDTTGRRSPRGPYSLSKKLDEIKEKNVEILNSNIQSCDMSPTVERNEEVEMQPENEVSKTAFEDQSQSEDNGAKKADDENLNLEMDLQENANSDESQDVKGKENSSELESGLNLANIERDARGMFQCPLCKYAGSTKTQLRSHFNNHSKPFQCDQCGLSFSSKASLRVHNRKHTGERPFSCTTCFAMFTTRGNLERHLLIHTGEKMFKCELCDKSFLEKKTMKVHFRKHTGERPYKCHVCGLAFAQRGVLQSHMAVHTNVREFLCDLCGKAFRQKSHLMLHKMRHEGARNFECIECHSKFITRADLERHMRKHSGEKPYVCELCGKDFTRQQSLNEHKNRHFGQRPHKCTYCVKTFFEASSLYKHMKMHKTREMDEAAKKREELKNKQNTEQISQQSTAETTVAPNTIINSNPQFDPSHSTTNTSTVCTDQLIEVENFSASPSKFLLLQMNGDALQDGVPVTGAAATDHIRMTTAVSDDQSTVEACNNIPVVEFASINMLSSARYVPNDSYG